jgi:hypothetical protein
MRAEAVQVCRLNDLSQMNVGVRGPLFGLLYLRRMMDECRAINWWNDWQEKLKNSEKTCLTAALFTTNQTCPDLDLNRGRRGGKPATNSLSYGTALIERMVTVRRGYVLGNIFSSVPRCPQQTTYYLLLD